MRSRSLKFQPSTNRKMAPLRCSARALLYLIRSAPRFLEHQTNPTTKQSCRRASRSRLDGCRFLEGYVRIRLLPRLAQSRNAACGNPLSSCPTVHRYGRGSDARGCSNRAQYPVVALAITAVANGAYDFDGWRRGLSNPSEEVSLVRLHLLHGRKPIHLGEQLQRIRARGREGGVCWRLRCR